MERTNFHGLAGQFQQDRHHRLVSRLDFSPRLKGETRFMSTPTIENIIVVMLENRSYDNVLGGLYLASNPVPYNAAPTGQTGLNGLADSSGQPGNYSNPNPNSSGETIPIGNQTTPTQLAGAGTYYPPTTIPVIDPGEYFSDMA